MRQIHREDATNAALLHGDAVKPVHMGHRDLLMRHDHKLNAILRRHIPDERAKSHSIGLIQWGIDLIEDADRGRLARKRRK